MNTLASLRDMRRFIILLVFLLIFFISLSPPQDADMWWHLSAGKAMVEQRQILTTDVFSYTKAGEPWTNAFWLPDIILYLSYMLGGYGGLTLLTALLAVLLMLLIYKQTVDAPFPLPLLVILLATFAIAPVWTPRPQIFSFVLLAVLDYGLNRQNGFILRHPWTLLPFFILWANVHGGFIWGFLLLFAFVLGSGVDSIMKRDHLIPTRVLVSLTAWSLVSALGIALNPNGLSLWKLPFYTVGVSIRSITEWASPDFHQIGLHPILWLLFLLIIGLANHPGKTRWNDILKTIGFAYMAFVSQRSIGPFVIIAAPVVIDSLRSLWEEGTSFFSIVTSRFAVRRTKMPVSTTVATTLNALILILFLFIAIMRAVFVSSIQEVHKGFPQPAVEWLKANKPEGRMFNAYNWGGYLQWELPEYPVYIDGRADLFGEKIIADWWTVVNGHKEAVPILDRWDVQFVILEPGWPILETLSEKGWHVRYRDELSVIMERP